MRAIQTFPQGQIPAAVSGLGFIGAVIYCISQAISFWVGVVGLLKAIVWPAFLVYYADLLTLPQGTSRL